MATEFGTGYCTDCRRFVAIEDQFPESTYEAGGEMGFRVTRFACGHETTTNPVRIGDAPGAPYAGEQTPVAATSQPWDMRAAQARADAIADPWGTDS